MSQLEQNLELLNRYLDPSRTVPNGPAFHEPLDGDPNSEIKKSMLEIARQVVAAGESTLSGNLASHRIDGSALVRAAEALMDDPESKKYSMLAEASMRVLDSIGSAKA